MWYAVFSSVSFGNLNQWLCFCQDCYARANMNLVEMLKLRLKFVWLLIRTIKRSTIIGRNFIEKSHGNISSNSCFVKCTPVQQWQRSHNMINLLLLLLLSGQRTKDMTEPESTYTEKILTLKPVWDGFQQFERKGLGLVYIKRFCYIHVACSCIN